jgi:hypothetical protein
VMPYGLDGRVSIRFRGKRFFSTLQRSDPLWGPPSLLWVPEYISPGVKGPGRGDDHSPPSNADVKNCAVITPHSPICADGVVLKQLSTYYACYIISVVPYTTIGSLSLFQASYYSSYIVATLLFGPLCYEPEGHWMFQFT